MNKLVLIDGSNLIFRAYFASEKQNIKSLDGRPAGAIRTLVSMINKIVSEEKPTHVFIALDTKVPTFRHEQYEEYKAGRSKTPEDLKQQFAMACELYDSMGIKHYGVDGYEADDVIATYATEAKANGFKVKILSGDKDLLQLVEDGIEVLTPKMGFAKEVNYTEEVFAEKFEFSPDRFIEYKSIVGDKSDNIIGIEMIGDKTARKLINSYDSYEKMVIAAQNGEVKGKMADRLAQALEQIEINIQLVTLVKDVPLQLSLDELKYDNEPTEEFINHLTELGFTKLVSSALKNTNLVEKPKESIKFEIISEFDSKVHTGKRTAVYSQCLTDNYFKSNSLGIAFSSDKGTFFSFEITNEIIKWLKSPAEKISYDLKTLCSIANCSIQNVIFDSYLAAALLDVTMYKMPIDYIMAKYGYHNVQPFEEVYKIKSNPQIPDDQILSADLSAKAQAIYETFPIIANSIEEKKLTNVLYDIELPLSPILSIIERNGITLDLENIEKLKEKYGLILDEINEKVKTYTTINISSPLQLSQFLFEERKLPSKGIKKTSRGYSTDVTQLTKLLGNIEEGSSDYKLIKLILEHRIYSKLLNTYVLGLEKNLENNNQIKPIYNQLLSETGRLSTREPSIQNIPIRSEEGQVIRSLFSVAKGYKLVAIDYSQIELRVMAHISNDKKLIEAFMHDADIHASTAKMIFGSSENNNRSKAKAINFGIIYGMSKYGLAKQVGISDDEAELFINKYFENYPSIKAYIENTLETVSEKGYVTTIYGRKREINDINSGNYSKREHAKNAAINTPVQGSAADLIKIAMIEVNKYIENTNTKMIMQIHDELVFEIKESELETEIKNICEIMQTAVELKVPLKVDYGIGDNWLEAK